MPDSRMIRWHNFSCLSSENRKTDAESGDPPVLEIGRDERRPTRIIKIKIRVHPRPIIGLHKSVRWLDAE